MPQLLSNNYLNELWAKQVIKQFHSSLLFEAQNISKNIKEGE